MAITRERKEDIVERYTALLQKTEGIIITEYRGMRMPAFNDLRADLRKVDASYMVTKNRLFKIALNNVGLPIPDQLLRGPVAVSMAHSDLPGMVKALLDRRKTQELLILKGGLIGQQIIGESDLEMISSLPNLETLRAQILGLLVQPAQNLVNILNAPAQNLVNVLGAGSNTLADVLAAYAAKANSGS